MTLYKSLIYRALLSFIAVILTATFSYGATFIVTTNADSGPGSLREAFILSNTYPGLDHIRFGISSTVITLNSPLPELKDRITLDGENKNITINGNSHSGIVLRSMALGSMIKAITLTNFGKTDTYAGAITVMGANACRIIDNTIVSSQEGIEIREAKNVIISGNYIGTDANGKKSGNNQSGISIFSSQNILIGQIEGLAWSKGNVISANKASGINLYDVKKASIKSNKIGVDREATKALGNEGKGINLNYSFDIEIGGTAQNAGNVIAANEEGIHMSACRNSFVKGNTIGVASESKKAQGNKRDGIVIDSQSEGIVIGDENIKGKNTIANNEGYAIRLRENVSEKYTSKNNIFKNKETKKPAPKTSKNKVEKSDDDSNTDTDEMADDTGIMNLKASSPEVLCGFEYTWVEQVGTADSDYGGNILRDAAGNLYALVYDGTTGDGTVRKYSAEGSLIWEINDAGSISKAAVDPSGNIYITGTNASGGYIAKYNTSGNLLWSESSRISSNGCIAIIRDIAVDNAGNSYIVGYFSGAVSFGTNNYTSQEQDIFVIKYNPSGTCYGPYKVVAKIIRM